VAIVPDRRVGDAVDVDRRRTAVPLSGTSDPRATDWTCGSARRRSTSWRPRLATAARLYCGGSVICAVTTPLARNRGQLRADAAGCEASSRHRRAA
jgi:hypothetical protein